MKPCVDCKHYTNNLTVAVVFSGQSDLLGHLCGVEGTTDPITGEPMYLSCRFMRSNLAKLTASPPPDCGPEGKLWEPR